MYYRMKGCTGACTYFTKVVDPALCIIKFLEGQSSGSTVQSAVGPDSVFPTGLRRGITGPIYVVCIVNTTPGWIVF
jgi:hypothetical protein